MVRITEQLVRKKSEHNECIIGTLEELSLHQEDVEKIEHLNKWCKNLKILYLQANIISKIEDLNKLKKLEYLNLAMNNIEKIENLERCESLQKLDLTLNFVGDLESVSSLQNNIHLEQLYLTGNPCCDFQGYREYVIVKLPQLRSLDSQEITKSERIKAKQVFESAEKSVKVAQERYKCFRREQIRRINENSKEDLSDDEFWKAQSENCPETRIEIANRSRRNKEPQSTEDVKNKQIRLFTKEGRPLNINQAKINFTFSDEDPSKYVLNLETYRYLDTSLIEVDLQPVYARITIKGKVFQFVFPQEIYTDQSTATRSETTGHLLLEMPLVNYKKCLLNKKETRREPPKEDVAKDKKNTFLEVQEQNKLDYMNIVKNCKKDIEENPDIPPLEFG